MSYEPPPIPYMTYDEPPNLPPVPAYPGSETMGVPRWPAWSLSVGDRFTLVPVSDEASLRLTAGEPLIFITAAGLRPVTVVRTRMVVAGELGYQFEAPLVDVLSLDGKPSAHVPEELYTFRLGSDTDRWRKPKGL